VLLVLLELADISGYQFILDISSLETHTVNPRCYADAKGKEFTPNVRVTQNKLSNILLQTNRQRGNFLY